MMYLNSELLKMGGMCEEAISCAVKYLLENDPAMKENVLDTEKQIDRTEREIESLCMKLLVHQQPVASDFRIITAALKMISDLERIGDQAEDIAEISEYVNNSSVQCGSSIKRMAETAVLMMSGSVDSFIRNDTGLAEKVIALDDVMDNLFVEVKKQVTESLKEGNADAEALLDIVMIAKYFERIGDHAENIAEWVIFSITGVHKNHMEAGTESE